MCPLTHIYIATKVVGRQNPLLIIGSVLSDFVWMSRKLPPDKIHDNLTEFYAFTKSRDKGMLDFALGMMLHSNTKGADDYSHFYKGGYAMTRGRVLIKDLVTLFKSQDEKANLYKAHNFIEAALDIHLLKANKYLPRLYDESLKAIDLEEIINLIHDFTKFDIELIQKDLASFFEIFGPKSVSSEKAFISNFFPPILKIAFHQEASKAEIQRILTKAKKLTEEDWEDLVEAIVKRMKKDFAKLI